MTVEPGSGASAAGLETGDIIKTIDGQTISTMDELISLLRRSEAGQETVLDIERAGASEEIVVVLGVRPN